ncbi:MAG: HNH endonuclease [Pleurocapsa minor HA4230-MV1]|nr:HNH endonuclease [Pleurocapsa minor HA4230-MV1]
MNFPEQSSTPEKILNPLRKLYLKDIEQRKAIVLIANNFKVRGVFLHNEVNFLKERLSVQNIDFDSGLLRAKMLTIELVPSTSWFSNVRSNVERPTWDILRKLTYRQARYKCEVCGGRGAKHPVECHEIWHYDDSNYIQTLSGLTALCPSCHQVKHIGLARLQGQGEKAEAQLSKVNDWTTEQTDRYIDGAFALWQSRSCHDWTLDLSWLDRYKIHIHC